MTQHDEPRFVQEWEADLAVLAGKCIAVVGYGNLGRPLSLNLRDSLMDSFRAAVIIGEVPGLAWEQAEADGFTVRSATKAAAAADVTFLLVSDEQAPAVYHNALTSALQPGSGIVFASGFNLAFGRICPDPSLDVLLLAPRMMGVGVRELYRAGRGFPSFVSVEHDATGRGLEILYALAKAIGSLRAGALTISAAQEAKLDLFVEQTVGPDLASAILTAFQVGVESGLPPEALLLELYMSGEMGRTFQAMAELGFFEQVKLHGFAAAYGGMVRFMELDQESRAQNYRRVIKEITEGAFADAVSAEVELGFPSQALLNEMLHGDNPVSQAEQRVRRMMRLNGAKQSGG